MVASTVAGSQPGSQPEPPASQGAARGSHPRQGQDRQGAAHPGALGAHGPEPAGQVARPSVPSQAPPGPVPGAREVLPSCVPEPTGQPGGPGVDWLYVRIYCGGGDDTDALLPEVARWLEGACSRWPVGSAHFLRFVDLRGHHVRLRLQAAPDVLDELLPRLDALDLASRRVEARTLPRLVPDLLTSTTRGRAGISCALYGPEYAKYGGCEGVLAAERHFDLSSRWCLENRVWRVPRPVPRVVLAARFLAQAARLLARAGGGREAAGREGADPGVLLGAHLRRWGRRLPARLRDGAALAPVVRQVLEQCPERGASGSGATAGPGASGEGADASDGRRGSPVGGRAVSWWRAEEPLAGLVEDAVRTAVRIGPGAAGGRALDLLHMDLNRIGVSPAEECVAGVCARYLVTRGALPASPPLPDE